MVQKIISTLIDDLDGSEATERVTFALGGNYYEIDLNDEHAAELRDAFARYVDAGRRTGGRIHGKAAARRADEVDTKAVRQYLKEQGHKLSDRGRIPTALVQKYKEAHADSPSSTTAAPVAHPPKRPAPKKASGSRKR